MTKPNDSLLSSEEQAVCEKVYNSNAKIHGLRAKILLALNEGLTQVKAGELTGMTIGQVRYCLKRFRELRTGMFSTQEQHRATELESKVSRQIVEPDSTAENSAKRLKNSEDKKQTIKKKDKKKKDGKKKDKKQKTKSGKKGKSDKKVKAKKSTKSKKNKKPKKKESTAKSKKKMRKPGKTKKHKK